MRIFEKYAVRVGGGYNHRYNLSDGVLLKDNHINAAGGVAEAVKAAQEYAPFVRKIEVETETLEMVREAVEAGADITMLDNMTPEDMKKACRNHGRKSENRVFWQCDQGKHRKPEKNRCRLHFLRCSDPFSSDTGCIAEKFFSHTPFEKKMKSDYNRY